MAAKPCDIFVSYAREDIDVASRLAELLEAKGYSVWWDFRLVAGTTYRDEIAGRIDHADKVLVIWSTRSIKSPFVIDEASRALQQEKLVPISVHDAQPPLGFGQLHTLFVSELDRDIDRIVAALRGEGSTKAPSRRHRFRLKRLFIPLGIVAVVVVAAAIFIDAYRLDYFINCVKYGCDLDYVTYRSRVIGLEFAYPRRHLMLDTMHESQQRLPLLNHKGEVEVTIFRSAMPSHRDPRRGSAEEQQALGQDGYVLNYVGPQVEPETKNFYILSGLRKDGKTFYFRRWYTGRDVVSAEYVYPPESIPLYDKVIVDMTIRSMRIRNPGE